MRNSQLPSDCGSYPDDWNEDDLVTEIQFSTRHEYQDNQWSKVGDFDIADSPKGKVEHGLWWAFSIIAIIAICYFIFRVVFLA